MNNNRTKILNYLENILEDKNFELSLEKDIYQNLVIEGQVNILEEIIFEIKNNI